jgi:hypothetical protein
MLGIVFQCQPKFIGNILICSTDNKSENIGVAETSLLYYYFHIHFLKWQNLAVERFVCVRSEADRTFYSGNSAICAVQLQTPRFISREVQAILCETECFGNQTGKNTEFKGMTSLSLVFFNR